MRFYVPVTMLTDGVCFWVSFVLPNTAVNRYGRIRVILSRYIAASPGQKQMYWPSAIILDWEEHLDLSSSYQLSDWPVYSGQTVCGMQQNTHIFRPWIVAVGPRFPPTIRQAVFSCLSDLF